MRIITSLLTLATIVLFFASASHADAPLKNSLGLNVEQASRVQAIQKQFRRKFSAARQELHREQRKLRRARSANDSAATARQESTVAALEDALREVRLSENEKIRQLLTPEQQHKFKQVIGQRRAMVGSSRDAKVLR